MESSPHQGEGPQAVAAGGLCLDAVVATMADLIVVTTGPWACAALAEPPVQVSLTPTVAHRIGEVLRCILQYPDLATRESIVEQWNAGELPHMPHGRVEIDMTCVRIGIEPLGAGASVPIAWDHVPALILQLVQATRMLMARR